MDVRVARTRSNVLRAATELLVEGGPGAVTIDAVVARSGVARSTIYRHWESRDEVLFDVIESCAPEVDPPGDELDFEAALRALVDQVRRMSNDPEWARILPALLTLRSQQHDLADLERRLEERQKEALGAVLQRGIDAGSLPADVDVEQAGALLIGPLVFAMLMDRPAIDDDFCDLVVTGFLSGYASRHASRATHAR
ncbi:TetR/AcrR family transcriptional regulator [Actinomarinicola tropica]|uniref:TetR family transcriptional regulator n=1 Tax=Actinomarinicola tropica TaxID=2789776 RepID=A0A5Q2RBP8_9ACTN|nr:TetR/AcrR family transcriptional regulator [Actinomarinicola tropica]QGG94258.1 TetR family transcriptional regulator [Actinomarinicola tropica]